MLDRDDVTSWVMPTGVERREGLMGLARHYEGLERVGGGLVKLERGKVVK